MKRLVLLVLIASQAMIACNKKEDQPEPFYGGRTLDELVLYNTASGTSNDSVSNVGFIWIRLSGRSNIIVTKNDQYIEKGMPVSYTAASEQNGYCAIRLVGSSVSRGFALRRDYRMSLYPDTSSGFHTGDEYNFIGTVEGRQIALTCSKGTEYIYDDFMTADDFREILGGMIEEIKIRYPEFNPNQKIEAQQ